VSRATNTPVILTRPSGFVQMSPRCARYANRPPATFPPPVMVTSCVKDTCWVTSGLPEYAVVAGVDQIAQARGGLQVLESAGVIASISNPGPRLAAAFTVTWTTCSEEVAPAWVACIRKALPPPVGV